MKPEDIVSKWENKEIVFPEHLVFTRQVRDTVDFEFKDADFKILTYVDTTGCISCKLNLPGWKNFIKEMDSLSNGGVPFVFIMHPKNIKEIKYILNRNKFDHPVCIDLNDNANMLNKFPSAPDYQTFLLDKDNKVLLVGNPVQKPNIKDLYVRIITGLERKKMPVTDAVSDVSEIDLGTIKVGEKRQTEFFIKNHGGQPLVVIDVKASCGCMAVEYDRMAADTGDSIRISLEVRPESTGAFNQHITAYCNTERPIRVDVYGYAK